MVVRRGISEEEEEEEGEAEEKDEEDAKEGTEGREMTRPTGRRMGRARRRMTRLPGGIAARG
eukprot:225810-Pyramimonas_sp.AAC.1